MKSIIAALGLAIVVLFVIAGRREGEIAVLKAGIQDDVRVATAERAVGDSIARRFRVDTVRLFRSTHTIDTLLEHRIDTALVHHTDTLTITVREAVAIQDTIRACRVIVSECAAGWASARRENAALVAETDRLRVLVPSKSGIWLRCAAGAGLGAAGGGAVAGGKDGALYAAGGALLGCFLVGR